VNLTLLPTIGDLAPAVAITMVDQQGRSVARVLLSAFRGRPLWINF
jgi:hypothetical protein